MKPLDGTDRISEDVYVFISLFLFYSELRWLATMLQTDSSALYMIPLNRKTQRCQGRDDYQSPSGPFSQVSSCWHLHRHFKSSWLSRACELIKGNFQVGKSPGKLLVWVLGIWRIADTEVKLLYLLEAVWIHQWCIMRSPFEVEESEQRKTKKKR